MHPIYREYLLENAKEYIRQGCLAIENGYIHLTRRGINISNTIMSDLMFV